jgi:hypothetical protein
MKNSLHTAEPVSLARPRGAHRFEAFSPRLAPRMTFFRRALVELWVLLEADPLVVASVSDRGTYRLTGTSDWRPSGFVMLIGMN